MEEKEDKKLQENVQKQEDTSIVPKTEETIVQTSPVEKTPKLTFKVDLDEIDPYELISNLDRLIDGYLSSRNWSQDRKNAFTSKYNLIRKKILNGDIAGRESDRSYIDTKSELGKANDAYNSNSEVFYYIDKILSARLPTKVKSPIKFDANSIMKTLSNLYFGGSDKIDLQAWEEGDYDKDTKVYTNKNRKLKFINVLNTLKSDINNNDYDFTGTAYKDKNDILNRIDNAIDILGKEGDDFNDELASLNVNEEYRKNLFRMGRDALSSFNLNISEEEFLKLLTEDQKNIYKYLSEDDAKKYREYFLNSKQREFELSMKENNENLEKMQEDEDWEKFKKNKYLADTISRDFYGYSLNDDDKEDYLDISKAWEMMDSLKRIGLTLRFINDLIHYDPNSEANKENILNFYKDMNLYDESNDWNKDFRQTNRSWLHWIPFNNEEDINTWNDKHFVNNYRALVEESAKRGSLINPIPENPAEFYITGAWDPEKFIFYTYDLSTNTIKIHRIDDSPLMLDAYRDYWSKNIYKKVSKKLQGGVFDENRKALLGSDINSLETHEKAGLRELEDGFTGTDVLRLAAMGADIASLVASFAPVYGTAASGVLGMGSTAAQTIADFRDESVTASQAFINLGTNLGLSVLGLIPGGKTGVILKNVKKWAPRIAAAYSASQMVNPEVLNSLRKIGSSDAEDNLTVEDWKNIGFAISTIAGVGRNVKMGLKARKLRRGSITTETPTIKVIKADGTEADLKLSKSQLEEFYTKLNKKGSSGEDFIKEITSQRTDDLKDATLKTSNYERSFINKVTGGHFDKLKPENVEVTNQDFANKLNEIIKDIDAKWKLSNKRYRFSNDYEVLVEGKNIIQSKGSGFRLGIPFKPKFDEELNTKPTPLESSEIISKLKPYSDKLSDLKILANFDKVRKENPGKSDSDIINSIIELKRKDAKPLRKQRAQRESQIKLNKEISRFIPEFKKLLEFLGLTNKEIFVKVNLMLASDGSFKGRTPAGILKVLNRNLVKASVLKQRLDLDLAQENNRILPILRQINLEKVKSGAKPLTDDLLLTKLDEIKSRSDYEGKSREEVVKNIADKIKNIKRVIPLTDVQKSLVDKMRKLYPGLFDGMSDRKVYNLAREEIGKKTNLSIDEFIKKTDDKKTLSKVYSKLFNGINGKSILLLRKDAGKNGIPKNWGKKDKKGKYIVSDKQIIEYLNHKEKIDLPEGGAFTSDKVLKYVYSKDNNNNPIYKEVRKLNVNSKGLLSAEGLKELRDKNISINRKNNVKSLDLLDDDLVSKLNINKAFLDNDGNLYYYKDGGKIVKALLGTKLSMYDQQKLKLLTPMQLKYLSSLDLEKDFGKGYNYLNFLFPDITKQNPITYTTPVQNQTTTKLQYIPFTHFELKESEENQDNKGLTSGDDSYKINNTKLSLFKTSDALNFGKYIMSIAHNNRSAEKAKQANRDSFYLTPAPLYKDKRIAVSNFNAENENQLKALRNLLYINRTTDSTDNFYKLLEIQSQINNILEKTAEDYNTKVLDAEEKAELLLQENNQRIYDTYLLNKLKRSELSNIINQIDLEKDLHNYNSNSELIQSIYNKFAENEKIGTNLAYLTFVEQLLLILSNKLSNLELEKQLWLDNPANEGIDISDPTNGWKKYLEYVNTYNTAQRDAFNAISAYQHNMYGIPYNGGIPYLSGFKENWEKNNLKY